MDRSTVAAVVATFGADRWRILARGRAIPSIQGQGFDEVLVDHVGASVSESRNIVAGRSRSEWLVFVDADDQLEDGYLEALRPHLEPGRLVAPAVRFDDDDPVVLDDRNIDRLNPCVIGTAIRTSRFVEVGGFWRERAWEDWSLFRRAWLLGDEIVHVPEAVYRVHVDPEGRNSTVSQPQQLHREIRRDHARWKRGRRAR